MSPTGNIVALVRWRRTVNELYAAVRHSQDSEAGWGHFQKVRDELFRSHAQSPLDPAQQALFRGLNYLPYDPAYRLTGQLDYDVENRTFAVELPGDGPFRFTQVAVVTFNLHETPLSLGLYWIEGYGGGLFLPFRDETNGRETYGGGRYLYDTIKGADLGVAERSIMLDFNFAYNPSCAYNAAWVCPLAPEQNRLAFAIVAGEQAFSEE